MLTLLLLVLGGLACLLPPAVYCLAVASLNHRPRPTIVPGSWDFFGVLLANAGFVILGGPAVLLGVNDAWRHGRFADLRGYDGSDSSFLWAAALYFVTVIVVCAWGLRQRRQVSVVYNVDAEQFRSLFRELLERFGLLRSQQGDRYFLAPPAPQTAAVVDLATAPALYSASLDWHDSDPTVRQQVENGLREAAATITPPENRLIGWLLTVATVLLAVILLGMVFFAVLIFTALRHPLP